MSTNGDTTKINGGDPYTSGEAAGYSSQGASMTAMGSDQTWTNPLGGGSSGGGSSGSGSGGGGSGSGGGSSGGQNSSSGGRR
ncbi:hypothetical protein QBC35DRAFT_449833 [Podospora australis]|uniref:Uncharacterized protein n=1 Tax=Podospora australis TaxID=1536484 RepID=A0AAN6X0T1_9PEZI|nr:hypothetical protein QBC35DRAFT_449833 [Podospora australis]